MTHVDEDVRAALRRATDHLTSPPSLVEESRRRGRRRLSRTRGLLAAGLVLAVGAATVGVAEWLRAPAGPEAAAPLTVPLPATIRQVAGGDAQHLYAIAAECPDGCPFRLYGSDDGGRSWQVRSPADAWPRPGMRVLGPRLLVAQVASIGSGLTENTSWPPATHKISTDGGRHWTDLRAGEPVEAVPAGGRLMPWVYCNLIDLAGVCPVHAVDPATGQVRRLASQPWLDRPVPWSGPGTDRLWVGGRDRATGRPAVASSTDGGRTWDNHVFTAEPPMPQEQNTPSIPFPQVMTDGGQTAYAVIGEYPDHRQVYRSTDGGQRWQQIPGGLARGLVPLLVTSDGAHVVAGPPEQPGGPDLFEASRDGRAYAPAPLAGLPPSSPELYISAPIERGHYLAYNASTVYLSTDGWTWHTVGER